MILCKMDPLGKQELVSSYNMHLRHFGDSPYAVRWTPEGQQLRFETLAKLAGDLNGKTILDFGCGKGDFCSFLKSKGISTCYCGIDINENLIALAKQKHTDAEFIAMDIDEKDFVREFDIVIVCGVFNLRIAGIEESMKNIMKKLFSLCREALHAAFLTYHVPNRDVELFYVKPEEILEFTIKEISKNVTLRHSGQDVFLSIYKQPQL